MNEETERNEHEQPMDAGSASERTGGLSDAEKERIRSEELHASEEREYRQQVRREMRGTSVWARALAMLKLEPGISEEIANDHGATRQALVVFVIAQALSGGLLLVPVSLLFLPISLAAAAIIILLVSLVSRLFSTDVPPYSSWFRALLFTTAPYALGVIPVVGTVIAIVYAIVLQIVVIRDLPRISTGQAVGTWLIAILLPIAALAAVVIAAVSLLGGIGLGLFHL